MEVKELKTEFDPLFPEPNAVAFVAPPAPTVTA
jgi:hypothetical protein